jgi:hypothetical protein
VPGAPGESLGADAAEHVVSRAQLLTGFTAKALPAQQFPVQQVAAGQVYRDTAPGQALDGFAVAGIGCLAVAQQRAERAAIPTAHSVPLARVRWSSCQDAAAAVSGCQF